MNDKSTAEIWYLFHSGFAVKTAKHFLIFDYYLDRPSALDRCLDSGVINSDEIKDLNVVVFSSHSHGDHFNPVILDWEKRIPKIRYILSDDIKSSKKASNMMFVSPGHNYKIEEMTVKVLLSTDIGAAFLVNVDGLTIFHAGDLNWWNWKGEAESENLKMARNYKKQIDLIKDTPVDFAFVPLDPRLEENYILGVDYFIKNIGVEMVFPMHFGDDYSVFDWLKNDERASHYRDKIVRITKRGEKFQFESHK